MLTLKPAPGLEFIENVAKIPVSGKFGTPAGVIVGILPYLFGIAGIILILNIIVTGYQMMTSAGEPKVLEMAKGKITTSIIGIVIILISFWLVDIVLNFFGIGFRQTLIL